VPLLTEKSKIIVDEPKRVKAKVTRWRKVALASMKQCRRSYIPEVVMPTALPDFLEQHDVANTGLVFHPGKGSIALADADLGQVPKRVILLVGPESGFSDGEVEAAGEVGFAAISLGRRILRTETAGPAVVALVMARLGEFR
jgi:16S rRNA (uracil1498-N3)-methyltransferase